MLWELHKERYQEIRMSKSHSMRDIKTTCQQEILARPHQETKQAGTETKRRTRRTWTQSHKKRSYTLSRWERGKEREGSEGTMPRWSRVECTWLGRREWPALIHLMNTPAARHTCPDTKLPPEGVRVLYQNEFLPLTGGNGRRQLFECCLLVLCCFWGKYPWISVFVLLGVVIMSNGAQNCR